MGVKGIEMSLIYSKVYSKIVLLISEMSRQKLFPTGNNHTRSVSVRKCTMFVPAFLIEKLLIWVQKRLR